jgi:hypothetical protein
MRCYNAAMLQRALFIIERFLLLIFAAHKIWIAVFCFYVAWKIAPFWVAAIPAILGSLFFFVGAIQAVYEIRRWRCFL